MNLCYNYLFLCKESFDLHRVSEWPSDALGRRLTVPVASPARDIAVASKRQRVIVTSGDRDEVTVHAVGRRLVFAVPAPARDAAVASQRQRVTETRGDRDEIAVNPLPQGGSGNLPTQALHTGSTGVASR